MRRGFTILELLVASLLLGMLMTILTMIFNQSSIAWRTGVAGVADMDDVREKVSGVRYQADNAYPVLGGDLKCIKSVFASDGTVVQGRAVGDFEGTVHIKTSVSADTLQYDESYDAQVSCPTGQRSDQTGNYTINVMSAGPDGVMDTYDDIWSIPDDPNEW